MYWIVTYWDISVAEPTSVRRKDRHVIYIESAISTALVEQKAMSALGHVSHFFNGLSNEIRKKMIKFCIENSSRRKTTNS